MASPASQMASRGGRGGRADGHFRQQQNSGSGAAQGTSAELADPSGRGGAARRNTDGSATGAALLFRSAFKGALSQPSAYAMRGAQRVMGPGAPAPAAAQATTSLPRLHVGLVEGAGSRGRKEDGCSTPGSVLGGGSPLSSTGGAAPATSGSSGGSSPTRTTPPAVATPAPAPVVESCTPDNASSSEATAEGALEAQTTNTSSLVMALPSIVTDEVQTPAPVEPSPVPSRPSETTERLSEVMAAMQQCSSTGQDPAVWAEQLQQLAAVMSDSHKQCYAKQCNNKAAQLIRSGQYSQAVGQCTFGLALLPRCPTLWTNRAAAHVHQRMWRPVVHDLDQALLLVRDKSPSMECVRNAAAWMLMGCPQEAMEEIDHGLCLAPQQACLVVLQECATADLAAAQQLQQRIAAMTHKQRRAHSEQEKRIADGYFMSRQLPESARHFSRSLSFWPSRRPNSWGGLAMCLLLLGMYRRGAAACDPVILRAKDMAWLLIQEAATLLVLGHTHAEEAIKDIGHAIGISPQHAFLHVMKRHATQALETGAAVAPYVREQPPPLGSGRVCTLDGPAVRDTVVVLDRGAQAAAGCIFNLREREDMCRAPARPVTPNVAVVADEQPAPA